MPDPCSISMNNVLRDKRYSDSFLRNTYVPLHDGWVKVYQVLLYLHFT